MRAIEDCHERTRHCRDETAVVTACQRERLRVAHRERSPGLHDPGAEKEPLPLRRGEEIGLELDGQDRGVGRHQGEGRITAGAIQSCRNDARMDEAVLLGKGLLIRHGEFDLTRRQPRDFDAEGLHGGLPGEARADAIVEIRVFRLK